MLCVVVVSGRAGKVMGKLLEKIFSVGRYSACTSSKRLRKGSKGDPVMVLLKLDRKTHIYTHTHTPVCGNCKVLSP